VYSNAEVRADEDSFLCIISRCLCTVRIQRMTALYDFIEPLLQEEKTLT